MLLYRLVPLRPPKNSVSSKVTFALTLMPRLKVAELMMERDGASDTG